MIISYFVDEIGMYYLQSRYYDPVVGRFVNADSAEYVSIQGGNLFAYCGNCPTNNADYFGFCYTPTYSEEIVEKLKNNTDNTTHQPSYTYDEAIGVGNNSITLEEFSKELKKIFKKVGIVVSDFIVNTLWKEWIVSGFWETFCKDWVAKKAWTWINGDKWYQILLKTVIVGLITFAIGAVFTGISIGAIIAGILSMVVCFVWEILSQGWNT